MEVTRSVRKGSWRGLCFRLAIACATSLATIAVMASAAAAFPMCGY